MNFEKSKNFKLKELAAYAEGSIVSKELLRKETGTLTIFAFDKGQGLSEHTSPYDAIVQVVAGVGTIRISKTDYSVGEGEIIIMPAGIPHAVLANEKFKMLLTMIKSKE